jgi:hypothetical protein
MNKFQEERNEYISHLGEVTPMALVNPWYRAEHERVFFEPLYDVQHHAVMYLMEEDVNNA